MGHCLNDVDNIEATYSEEKILMSLRPPQIPRGLAWNRTRPSRLEAGGQLP
jgi:hypothetical protein